ncbi:MAG: hypothetical protein GWM88_12370 [Pseudomonadales bacterium]|nr:hypothetical protein [Pseudomonadales bacterium]NIX08751.1 hypothetical protein [Pseudomonadales bacterium]
MTGTVIIRVALAYVLSVLVAYLLAATAATQAVLAGLEGLGVTITMGERITTTGRDLAGMLPTFGLLIAVGFAIALPIAVAVSRFVPSWRAVGLVAAGAAAVGLIHYGLNSVFETHLIAATRTTVGFLVQVMAGGVGGYAFYLLRDP